MSLYRLHLELYSRFFQKMRDFSDVLVHTEIWQSQDFLGIVDCGAQVILNLQRKPEITQDYLGTVTYSAQVILRLRD